MIKKILFVLAISACVLLNTVERLPAQGAPAAPEPALTQARQGTRPVELRRRPPRRRDTGEVRLPTVPSFAESMGENAPTPPAASGPQLEEMTVSEAEMPRDLIFSRVPKFPDNPALLRDERDLKRIAREAFDQELYWRNWEAVRVTLLTDGLNESIAYYIIALQFRADLSGPQTAAEVERLRSYMSRIAGSEVIILEKLPLVVVIASDMQGPEQFANAKKLAELIEKRLHAEKNTENVGPGGGPQGTGEVEAGVPGR